MASLRRFVSTTSGPSIASCTITRPPSTNQFISLAPTHLPPSGISATPPSQPSIILPPATSPLTPDDYQLNAVPKKKRSVARNKTRRAVVMRYDNKHELSICPVCGNHKINQQICWNCYKKSSSTLLRIIK